MNISTMSLEHLDKVFDCARAGCHFEVKVSTINVRHRHVKENFLDYDVLVVDQAECSSSHPEAIAPDTLVPAEAPVVAIIGPDLSLEAVRNTCDVRERPAKVAELCVASILGGPFELPTLFFMRS